MLSAIINSKRDAPHRCWQLELSPEHNKTNDVCSPQTAHLFIRVCRRLCSSFAGAPVVIRAQIRAVLAQASPLGFGSLLPYALALQVALVGSFQPLLDACIILPACPAGFIFLWLGWIFYASASASGKENDQLGIAIRGATSKLHKQTLQKDAIHLLAGYGC